MQKLNAILILIVFFAFQLVQAQNKELLTAINLSLIGIENSNQDYALKETYKFQNVFENVQIFGFGEATHGTKEFQDLKVKFFKHLVLNYNVKIFALEANYGNCLEINSYIQNGEGNPRNAIHNIGYWIWNTEEMLSLIEWMKLYNSSKSKENKLSFIGIDVTNCQYASNQLYKQLQNNSFLDNEKYLKILSNYNSSINLKNLTKKDFEEHHFALETLALELKNLKNAYLGQLNNSVLQYIALRLDYNEALRDQLMFENVNWLLENTNCNIFICAHNMHISKKYSSYNSLGYHLKNKYAEKYYSVGFDFGSGSFNAFEPESNVVKKYFIDKPLKKTSTAVFNNASSNVYFLDLNKSVSYLELNKFVLSKSYHREIGSVYSPKMIESVRLQKVFDAIIFVKKAHETNLLH